MVKFLAAIPLVIALVFIGAFVNPLDSINYLLPTETRLSTDPLNPINYSLNIDLENSSFDKQGYNMCSGFAAAFIHRYYGQPASGTQIYQEIAYKLPVDIGVPPHRLISHFKDNNLKAAARTGELDELKYFSSQDIPVIVLVGEGLKWQHYMVLLGYSEADNEMYFYDPESGPAMVVRKKPGNKTLKTDEFLAIWKNNLPFFSQVFITVEKIQMERST
ncbi:MAG: C39 family peptidase [Halarsenatibacteraceae bacterium]